VSSRAVTIVDVCSGNLRSVERALERSGATVTITRDPDVVRRADKVVVPGQGSFGVFMSGLVERGLTESLREAISSGKPYLGICLGLQVLFDSSEEQGPCAGLGIISGKVIRLAPKSAALKVPHMGWNRVHFRRHDPLFRGIDDGAQFYFVHSFHALPTDPSLLAAAAEHGVAITAAIRKDNVFACQFHPEKSQAVGLRLLSNFVEAP
jgi:glutamine amidotransferase